MGRYLKNIAVQATREQIAADLHDELGANFPALGLLSDLATRSADEPEKLKRNLGRIRELTERCGKAAARSANLLEANDLYDDLIEGLKRTSQRVTADLTHEFKVTGEDPPNLDSKRRADVLLFHKECLVNAIRHSNSTEIMTELQCLPDGIKLIVTDNGIGQTLKFSHYFGRI